MVQAVFRMPDSALNIFSLVLQKLFIMTGSESIRNYFPSSLLLARKIPYEEQPAFASL